MIMSSLLSLTFMVGYQFQRFCTLVLSCPTPLSLVPACLPGVDILHPTHPFFKVHLKPHFQILLPSLAILIHSDSSPPLKNIDYPLMWPYITHSYRKVVCASTGLLVVNTWNRIIEVEFTLDIIQVNSASPEIQEILPLWVNTGWRDAVPQNVAFSPLICSLNEWQLLFKEEKPHSSHSNQVRI